MLRSPQELLRQTLELYRAHFWLLIGYSSLIPLPIIGVTWLATIEHSSVLVLILTLTSAVLSIFVLLWVVTILVLATNKLSAFKIFEPKALSLKAAAKISPLFLTGLLVGVLQVGGLLLLIIPGFIFTVWYSQATLAVVLENKRPLEALTRSRKLTKGRFWQVAWRLIVPICLLWIAYILLVSAPTIAVANLLNISIETLLDPDVILVWPETIEAISYIFLIPPHIIYLTLLYKDLKQTALEPQPQLS